MRMIAILGLLCSIGMTNLASGNVEKARFVFNKKSEIEALLTKFSTLTKRLAAHAFATGHRHKIKSIVVNAREESMESGSDCFVSFRIIFSRREVKTYRDLEYPDESCLERNWYLSRR